MRCERCRRPLKNGLLINGKRYGRHCAKASGFKISRSARFSKKQTFTETQLDLFGEEYEQEKPS